MSFTRTGTIFRQSEFANPQFWADRYTSKSSFDWYVGYAELAEYIKLYTNPSQSVCLSVGCGNSVLSNELCTAYPLAFVINVDIVFTALNDLRSSAQFCQAFLCTDGTRPCGLREGLCDFVIEKGTVDALMSNDQSDAGQQNAADLLTEIRRVLADDGLAFMISHSPRRDSLISCSGLQIAAVHRCFLSDEAIIINALRTTGEARPLVEKLGNEAETIQAFTEIKERIAKKKLANVLRKFMKNVKHSDNRKRGGGIVSENKDDFRKQDFCWIYVLTK